MLTPVSDGRSIWPSHGNSSIAGVDGTAAPVNIRFLNTAGSIADGLLPTGNLTDVVTVADTAYTVTLIDNGQPLVIIAANDLGLTGYETVAELTANEALKARLEDLRVDAVHTLRMDSVCDVTYA